MCARRTEFQQGYQEYWNTTKAMTSSQRPVNGVIMPVASTAAVQGSNFTYFGLTRLPIVESMLKYVSAYSAIANLLDYSTGSSPMTFANKALDPEMPNYQFISDDGRTIWEKCEYLRSRS